MRAAVLVSLLAVPAFAAQVKVSPVQKVVQLLGDLKSKIQKELDAEGKAMDEYAVFCDDEVTETKFAIKTATDSIGRYEAAIAEAEGKIQEYDATIASAGTEVAAKQTELADASSVRKDENNDFVAAEKELVDTIDMLARAAAVLKRELSFAQGGKIKRSKIESMVNALGLLVEASWISNKNQKALSAFLEQGDELSLTQPQAKVVAYESKSGGIVQTILDMQDEAEGNLASLRKEEMKKKHTFEMLQQSLTDAIANLEEESKEAAANKSTSEEGKAKAEEDLAKTQASKAADEEYLKTTSHQCQTKASEWEQRQKSAAEEMGALDKAKEILSSGVKVFVQKAVSTKRVAAASVADSDDMRSELVRKLRSLGREYNSFAMMQVANAARADPFKKIRGMIEEMIAKLEKQAQEEATHHAFCTEEKAKSKKARENKTASVEKYQVRVDKAKAGIESLENEVAELSKQLSDLDKAVAEATKIRTQEKADYEVASKDQKDSIEAVAMAMEVLQKFYGGASFIQQPSFGGAKSDAGGSILSFLEVAQSDFTKMLAETEANESEAKEAYEKFSQDSKVSKAMKQAEVKGKTSEIKSLKVAVKDNSDDLATANKELDAVLEYIEKLKPQCEVKAMTYEEKKAKREAEINGLKSALEILEGEAPAFLQKRSFLSRRA